MRNLLTFNEDTKDCTYLEDFVLTPKEWAEYEKGTKAIKVRTYNDSGNSIRCEYVLRDIDNMEEVLNDMQSISTEYYTETFSVTHL